MIPIDFMLKDETHRDKITDFFYKTIIGKCDSQELLLLDQWCKANLIINGEIHYFKDVVVAEPDKLAEIKNLIDDNNISMNAFYKYNPNGKRYCYIVDKIYKKQVPRRFLVESLGVTVCPYCNRNFVNSSNERTFCQLDHFINKSEYPIFAVSFYNLIPVCPSCNHAKGTKSFDLSPHDARMKPNELVQFGYHILDADYLFDHSKIVLSINYSNVLSSNIKELNLENLYQLHTDLVQEIIKKAFLYNETYLEVIQNNADLFSSREELYRVVFGNYLNESEFSKRPLTKLTYDICKSLGISCLTTLS